MRILMMTNTYFPIVGGLEQSVFSFSEEFRTLGHEVLIVTPEFEGMPTETRHGERRALQRRDSGRQRYGRMAGVAGRAQAPSTAAARPR